jgi:hypothetical protein
MKICEGCGMAVAPVDSVIDEPSTADALSQNFHVPDDIDAVADTEDIGNDEGCEVQTPVEKSSMASGDSILTLRRRLILQCQTLIAKASVCTSREAFECALSHTRTAVTSMLALSRNRMDNFCVKTRMPANKKLVKQLRFFSTRAKRRATRKQFRKPHSAELENAKKKLQKHTVADSVLSPNTMDREAETANNADGENHDATIDAADICHELFDLPVHESEGVPYVVDTEEVLTNSSDPPTGVVPNVTVSEDEAVEGTEKQNTVQSSVVSVDPDTSSTACGVSQPSVTFNKRKRLGQSKGVRKRITFDSSMPYNEGNTLKGKGNWFINLRCK